MGHKHWLFIRPLYVASNLKCIPIYIHIFRICIYIYILYIKRESYIFYIYIKQSIYVVSFVSIYILQDILTFTHPSVCLTTGPQSLPKPVLHIVRSSASSVNLQYPRPSLRLPSTCLRLLPPLPVTYSLYLSFNIYIYAIKLSFEVCCFRSAGLRGMIWTRDLRTRRKSDTRFTGALKGTNKDWWKL